MAALELFLLLGLVYAFLPGERWASFYRPFGISLNTFYYPKCSKDMKSSPFICSLMLPVFMCYDVTVFKSALLFPFPLHLFF